MDSSRFLLHTFLALPPAISGGVCDATTTSPQQPTVQQQQLPNEFTQPNCPHQSIASQLNTLFGGGIQKLATRSPTTKLFGVATSTIDSATASSYITTADSTLGTSSENDSSAQKPSHDTSHTTFVSTQLNPYTESTTLVDDDVVEFLVSEETIDALPVDTGLADSNSIINHDVGWFN